MYFILADTDCVVLCYYYTMSCALLVVGFSCPEVFYPVLEVHGRTLIDLKVQRIAV